MNSAQLKWDSQGLVTVIVQDQHSGEVRMLAHANREAVDATLTTGDAHFFSRSRQSLWRKGESSGHTIRVAQVWADCDADALIYLSEPNGPSCHTNADNCFYQRLFASTSGEGIETSPGGPDAIVAGPTLVGLWRTLERRKATDGEKSYTKHLLEKGVSKIGEKVREEAGEFDAAMADETDERVVSEAADVLYHVMVGLLARGVSLRDVEAELARRFGVSGHEEKAARPPKDG